MCSSVPILFCSLQWMGVLVLTMMHFLGMERRRRKRKRYVETLPVAEKRDEQLSRAFIGVTVAVAGDAAEHGCVRSSSNEPAQHGKGSYIGNEGFGDDCQDGAKEAYGRG